jgi:hypothetical protein
VGFRGEEAVGVIWLAGPGGCGDTGERLEVEARAGALALRGAGLALGNGEGKEGGTER